MTRDVSGETRRQALKRGASLLGVSVCGAMLPGMMSGCETDTLKSTGTTVEFDLSSRSRTVEFDITSLDEDAVLDVAAEPALAAVGGAVMRSFGAFNQGQKVVIVRTEERDFTVLSTVCTHLGCEVGLPAADGTMTCPCHQSMYSSADGSVLRGPAERALTRFPVVYDEGTAMLTITFSSGLPETGGAVKQTFPGLNNGNPVIVIRRGPEDFTVLTAACTSDGCELNLPEQPGGDLICPCDGSVYSPVDGSVVQGPASSPLTLYPARYTPETGILSITYETDLPASGGAVKETFGSNNNGRSVIIVRSSDAEFATFTSVCTHQGCEVGLPGTPGGDFVCPCHNSAFSSLTGAVKRGPAGTPLRRFSTVFDPGPDILKITF